MSTESILPPLVTIGLPVFNGGKTLHDALASLVNQDYPNFQLIISDNASTDSTLEVCEHFASKDPRITIIKKQENEGALANFKTVLNAAEGEFFMWAAADDYWHKQFISRLLPKLQADPAVGVAMCAVERRYTDGTLLDTVRFTGNMNPNNMAFFSLLAKILSGAKYNLFIYGLFRRDLLRKSTMHFPEVLGGDRQFIAMLSLSTRFCYVDEVLLTRTHQEKNADSYLEELSKKGSVRKQVWSLVTTLLGSTVIPWQRKICVPYVFLKYGMFCLKQKTHMKMRQSKMKNVLRKFSITKKNAMSIALMFFVSAVTLGLLSISGLLAYEFSVIVLSFIFGLVLNLIVIRRWLVATQKAIVQKLYTGRSGQIAHASGDENNNLFLVLKELRYISDSLLHPELVAPKLAGNDLSTYAKQQIDRQRRMVEFTRCIEGSKIREVYLQELFAGIEEVSVPIGVINEMTGHANKADMLYVASVAKHSGARKIFEFGTYMGRTTYAFAHNNPEAEVFTLNLPVEEDSTYAPFIGALLEGRDEEKRVTKIQIDSQDFNTSPYKKQFDFVFVDAGHTYDLVKNDTEKAFELLKPGGIIMWHDYAYKSDGLVRYFKEFTQDCPLFRIRSTCLLVYIDGVDVMNHELVELPETLESKYRQDNPLIPESIYHLQ